MEYNDISRSTAKLLLKYYTKREIGAELYSALSLYAEGEIEFNNIKLELIDEHFSILTTTFDKIEEKKLVKLKSQVNSCIGYLMNKLELNIGDKLLLGNTKVFSDPKVLIKYLVNMGFDGKSMILLFPKGTEIYSNSITYFIQIITKNSIHFGMRLGVTEKKGMMETYSDFDLFDDSLYIVVQNMLNSSNNTVYELFNLNRTDVINYLRNN